ncbi:MAG: hypothetical protein IJP89_00475 [Synergistaceae bacterium]|nr:hypothetical protein [Synergistaceae bacterium]
MTLTSLNARENVPKSHPRIELRGKLDTLNAQIIFLQSDSHSREYVSDLEEIRGVVNHLQKCEAGEKLFAGNFTLWGMNEDEIHTRSHNPMKYYGIGHILPHYDMGRESAGLNLLRTLMREAELCAVRAFGHEDSLRICHALNRLSSALYILTYKYLPQGYNRVMRFGSPD